MSKRPFELRYDKAVTQLQKMDKVVHELKDLAETLKGSVKSEEERGRRGGEERREEGEEADEEDGGKCI